MGPGIAVLMSGLMYLLEFPYPDSSHIVLSRGTIAGSSQLVESETNFAGLSQMVSEDIFRGSLQGEGGITGSLVESSPHHVLSYWLSKPGDKIA